MDNERTFPRMFPRAGKDISINFGGLVDSEKVFGPFRERWRNMKEKAKRKQISSGVDSRKDELGVITDDDLKYSEEAKQLRIEVTMAIRNEVLKVRRSCGLEDEDPKRGLADTWREEGKAVREGVQQDGSSVRAP